jgi:hypothetical protein
VQVLHRVVAFGHGTGAREHVGGPFALGHGLAQGAVAAMAREAGDNQVAQQAEGQCGFWQDVLQFVGGGGDRLCRR